jgi:hypothetical protein
VPQLFGMWSLALAIYLIVNGYWIALAIVGGLVVLLCLVPRRGYKRRVRAAHAGFHCEVCGQNFDRVEHVAHNGSLVPRFFCPNGHHADGPARPMSV